jgi:Tol biopolymer transport system component
MGEVYRATDRNLSRQVAIKVLPHAVSADADRLARFDREAKTLAALNHPNIAAIYGLERNDSTTALVMELVEGPTLADRILQGAIPVDEAIRIAREIADALEAAHEQGIVHRDLKPANIKQHRNGTVKVLDFGLAKTTEPATSALTSASPTVMSPAMTETGIILGTAAYMSPEQAKGLTVDHRCDVWAFACVLYEMLTGRRAFSGHGVTETLAAILERDVDWSALPASTPASVRTLLRRALAKDPRRRLHHIADARLELEDAHAAPERPAIEPPRRVPWLWLAIATVALIAIVVSAWRVSSSSSPVVTLPTARLSFVPDPPLSPDAIGVLAMSPDGQRIAYVAGKENQIYVRDIDRFDARALPETEGTDLLVFSPDGKWIAFQANDKVKKVALAGGAPIPLAESAEGHGLGWESNEAILFGPGRASPISRVAASGGPSQMVTAVQPGENSHQEPEGLPGGKAILYRTNSGSTLQIYAQSLVTGQRHLIDQGLSPHYLNSGHVGYVQDGALVVVPFDMARLEKTGPPTVIASDVREMGSAAAQVAFSQVGSLAYVPAVGGRRDTLVWVDPSGAEQPTTIAGEAFRMPRLSPDQQRLVIHVGSTTAAQGAGPDLWIYDLASNRRNRLTFDGASTFPLWEPGGTGRMVFSSRQSDGSTQILMKTFDGTTPDTPIVSPRGTNYSLSWSPDGRFVATVAAVPDTYTDIWVLTLGSSPTWQPFLKTRFREGAPTFSHDNRLIAYASDQSGRSEIYVRPFPGGSEVTVSVDGGTEPLFARGAPTLFYRHGDEMLAVEITPGPPIVVGTPRVIFKRPYERSDGVWPNYDVTPDGKRLLLLRRTEQNPPTRVNVVLNWLDELKRLAPAK